MSASSPPEIDELSGRIDTAARYAEMGDLTTARAVLDVAALHPDAERHADRIRAARDWLVRRGAYDEPWVPEVKHWRRCPALGHPCPHADVGCALACGLVEGGWEDDSKATQGVLI